ncbi:MAG: endolytic transglycosylase MltG [Clostridiales bacterium]|jgi:UPF0755 protein|nr:endolytic transglycosylase MltG [Clostridiales bacterium]
MKRRRRKNNKKSIIAIIIAIVAVYFVLVICADFFGLRGDKSTVAVPIPSGTTNAELVDILKDKGVINIPFLFKIYLRTDSNFSLKAGDHVVLDNFSYSKIKSNMNAVPAPDGIKIVIPEGYEVRQIADLLEENGLINRKKFYDELENGAFDYPFIKNISRKENRLEGYLFPATYMISQTESEHEIIDKMLNKFNQVFDLSCYNAADNLKMTSDQVITLASIIEREAQGDVDRSKVSSVFHNRLDIGMPLQSCATVQYILKERKPVLSVADTQIKSPYNTYINKGLPIGPIAAPGEKAINAALYPADTDYYYFVFTNGKHIFSKTLEEHNRAQ